MPFGNSVQTWCVNGNHYPTGGTEEETWERIQSQGWLTTADSRRRNRFLIVDIAGNQFRNDPEFGRKNFLFHYTVKGARASSIIYSLVETAKHNNLNIYVYLQTVLLYMPDYKDEPEGIEELMPWSEKMQRECRFKSKK